MSEGHELARQQIAKHGKDRYPTAWQQACKVGSELRELLAELDAAGYGAQDGELNERIGDEFADVGLALYELGNKLGFDLIERMRELVAADTRSFA
jgi:NTP pyrophosphatase (non-canonical NTP hydrolase)